MTFFFNEILKGGAGRGVDFVLGEGKGALSSLWEGDSGEIIIIFSKS